MEKYAEALMTMLEKPTLCDASKTTSTKLNLLKEAFGHKPAPGTPLANQVAEMELIFTKLSAAGHDLERMLQVSFLLSSLSGIVM